MWSAGKQAAPRAVEILELLGENPHDHLWSGLCDDSWRKLVENQPIAAEFIQLLKDDFPTFSCCLFHLVPKGAAAGPFLFNNPQRLLWDEMVKLVEARKPLFIIILKARQLGMSSFLAAYVFWNCWREKDFKALVMAHEVKLGDHIIRMMSVAYDHLPKIKGIRPDLRQQKAGARLPRSEMYFSNNRSGAIIQIAKNYDPRGMDARLLWQSEKAFYEKAAKLDSALLPQLPSRGSEARLRCAYIRESTPNGQNDFHAEYDQARPLYSCQTRWGENEEAEDVAAFFPWILHDEIQFGGYAIPIDKNFKLDEHEERERKRLSKIRRAYEDKDVSLEQMAWRRATINGHPYYGDEDYFNMEYPGDDRSCWLTASDNAFRHVMKYLDECVQSADDRATEAWAKSQWKVNTKGALVGDIEFEGQKDALGKEAPGTLKKVKFTTNPKGHLTVWEPPQAGEKYCAFLDPCNGVMGGDDACIEVASVRDCRQVAEWCMNINPVDAVDMLCAIGAWYNNALINAEINIHGYTILERANFRMYHNQYKWHKFDEANKLTQRRFWETNPRSRMLMFNTMVRFFEQQMYGVSSLGLIKELSTFEKNFEAEDTDGARVSLTAVYRQQKGQSDDRVMATAGVIVTIKQVPILWDDFTPFQKPPSAAALGLQDRAVIRSSVVIKSALDKDEKAQELIKTLMGEAVGVGSWNPLREQDVEYPEPW